MSSDFDINPSFLAVHHSNTPLSIAPCIFPLESEYYEAHIAFRPIKNSKSFS